MILGKLNADGSRQLGLIDKYCGNDSGGAAKIISNVSFSHPFFFVIQMLN